MQMPGARKLDCFAALAMTIEPGIRAMFCERSEPVVKEAS
jgi:hypothetical protein